MTERSHKGLVQREIVVKRGGKSFKQMRWVKPGNDEPEKRKGKKNKFGDIGSKKEDFVNELKIGDIVNVAGKLSKVKTINKKSRTVIVHNDFLGNEVYDFDELNQKGILETPEGRFKPNSPIKFLGKDLKIKKVSESQKTVKLSDDKVYTFEAIKHGMKSKELTKEKPKEKTIKDLKPKKEKTPKIVNTDELTKRMELFESGLAYHPDGDDMIECVGKYTSVDYGILNKYLKDEKIGDDEKIDKRINHIDTFLKNAPKMKGIVYRGMKFNDDKKLNKFLKEIEKEKSFKFRAFTSTSTKKGIAEDFGGWDNRGIIFEIKSKSGVYLNGVSELAVEHEVLFNKNSKFNIINIDKSNSENVKIIVEEI